MTISIKNKNAGQIPDYFWIGLYYKKHTYIQIRRSLVQQFRFFTSEFY